MGVKDLLSWVKKTYPQAIVSYPRRWASPEISGKRVAIDGTLLTNRYHFATRDGPHGEKGPMIGWYNLISEMRAQGVKPVAIWDERGVREWKAPEARRRLTVRAGHLARRNHEIDRTSRLQCLRDTLSDFEQMSEEEQELIRSQWETTRFMFSSSSSPSSSETGLRKSKRVKSSKAKGKTEPEPDATACHVALPTPPSTPRLPASGDVNAPETVDAVNEYALTTMERVTTMIDALAHLVQEYREHTPSSAASTDEQHVQVETENIGLEHIHEELEEQIASRAAKGKEKEEREEYVRELDETLAELVPAEKFRETRRQAELTRAEGEIINLFLSLSKPTQDHVGSALHGYPTPPPSPSPLPISDDLFDHPPKEQAESVPMDHLDTLIAQRAPLVQAIYDRALDIPSPADHEDCKELLRIMGVPVLEAKIPYEAEGMAAALAKEGLVDFVGTEDSDVLAYEGPLLRHLSPATSPLTYISGEILREHTELSAAEYLDFMILLGTDASPRIPKIGPVNAFRLIRQYGTIEGIIRDDPGVRERISDLEGFMEMVLNARKVFMDLPPVQQFKHLLDESESESKGAGEGEVERREEEVESWFRDNHGIQLVNPAPTTSDGVDTSDGWNQDTIVGIEESVLDRSTLQEDSRQM